jgi:hypothetical protein
MIDAEKNRAEALFFNLVRVPQASKVRFLFSSLDGISSPLVGRKALFFADSLLRFHPEDSTAASPQVSVCRWSLVSRRPVH